MNETRPAWLVAHHLLWLRRNIETTPMHVIKLVYLSHGWMLGAYHRPLLGEPVEAWQYGPVVPSVYHTFKSFGADPVSIEAVDMSPHFDEDQRQNIESVIESYKGYTAIDLSDITHRAGTPWDKTVRQHGVGSIIPDRLIEDHYSTMLKAVGY